MTQKISEVRAAFATYYKAERDRCEKTLVDILDIMCKPGTDEAQIDAIHDRLEQHWGRYGEPGSLAPLGAALADLPADALGE